MATAPHHSAPLLSPIARPPAALWRGPRLSCAPNPDRRLSSLAASAAAIHNLRASWCGMFALSTRRPTTYGTCWARRRRRVSRGTRVTTSGWRGEGSTSKGAERGLRGAARAEGMADSLLQGAETGRKRGGKYWGRPRIAQSSMRGGRRAAVEPRQRAQPIRARASPWERRLGSAMTSLGGEKPPWLPWPRQGRPCVHPSPPPAQVLA